MGSLFLIFLLLLGVVIGLFGVKMYLSGKFGKFDRFNVVVAGKQVELFSFDTTSHSVVVVTFPDDLYMTDVFHGYGQYRISAVYAVGQLDKRGGETLSGTVGDYLGIPVEGYFINGSQAIGSDPQGLFLSPGMIFAKATNLNFLDRIRLAQLAMGIRTDKVTKIDLSSWAAPLVLADGSNVQFLDKAVLDNDLPDIFSEEGIRAEKLRVEVLNSTGEIGLGNRAARILTNIGATVINVGDTNVPLVGCKVSAVKDFADSVTVRRIAAAFSCQVEQKVNNGRADVTVIVGKDYSDSLNR